MSFGLEIEFSGVATAADLDVIVCTVSDRYGLVRKVGDAGEEIAELVVEELDFFVEGGDPVADFPDLLLAFAGVGTGLAQFGDLRALGVAARLKLFGFGDGGAAALIQIAELIETRDGSTRGKALGDLVEVGAEKSQIVHLAYASARRTGSTGRSEARAPRSAILLRRLCQR